RALRGDGQAVDDTLEPESRLFVDPESPRGDRDLERAETESYIFTCRIDTVARRSELERCLHRQLVQFLDLDLRSEGGKAHGIGSPVADEDVGNAIRVPRNEVGGRGGEGDEASFGAHRRREADEIPFCARAVDAHPLGLPCRAIVDEDVDRTVRVPRDEVGGQGREGDEASVGGDRDITADESGNLESTAAVRLPASAVHAHALGCPGLTVPDKDVEGVVRVPHNDVGDGGEGDEAPVGADRWGYAVRRRAGVEAVHRLGLPCRAIVDEDPGGGEKSGQHGDEGDEASVAAHRWQYSVRLPGSAVRVHALGRPRLTVPDKHVEHEVRVPRDEVGGPSGESDESDRRGDRRAAAVHVPELSPRLMDVPRTMKETVAPSPTCLPSSAHLGSHDLICVAVSYARGPVVRAPVDPAD